MKYLKKYYIIIILLVFILPINVKANIICNDGTVSNSCQDCHQGCCSKHGGCDNPPSVVEQPKPSTPVQTNPKPAPKKETKPKEKVIVENKKEEPKVEVKEEPKQEEKIEEQPKEEVKENNEEIKENPKDEKTIESTSEKLDKVLSSYDDYKYDVPETNPIPGIIVLAGLGFGGYHLYKRKTK